MVTSAPPGSPEPPSLFWSGLVWPSLAKSGQLQPAFRVLLPLVRCETLSMLATVSEVGTKYHV